MTKKTFSWNLKDRQFNNLKAINKEILYKSYTRNFLKEDQKVKLIDNSSNISDIFLRKQDYKRYRIGTSIKAKTTILKSIYWDKLQIAMPFLMKPKKKGLVTKLKFNLLTFQKKFQRESKNYQKKIQRLEKLMELKRFKNSEKFQKKFQVIKKKIPIKKYPIIVKKPVKGGFNAECLGLKGFISKKQYNFVKKPKTLGEKFELEYFKLKKNIPKKVMPNTFKNKHSNFKQNNNNLNNTKQSTSNDLKKIKNDKKDFIIKEHETNKLITKYNKIKEIKKNNDKDLITKQKNNEDHNVINKNKQNDNKILNSKNNKNETKFNKKADISSNSKK